MSLDNDESLYTAGNMRPLAHGELDFNLLCKIMCTWGHHGNISVRVSDTPSSLRNPTLNPDLVR